MKIVAQTSESSSFIVIHMLLYRDRDRSRFYRKTKHHLLWGSPGYQVNSGQNRKAQC